MSVDKVTQLMVRYGIWADKCTLEVALICVFYLHMMPVCYVSTHMQFIVNVAGMIYMTYMTG
jgi:hypothetical protein